MAGACKPQRWTETQNTQAWGHRLSKFPCSPEVEETLGGAQGQRGVAYTACR